MIDLGSESLYVSISAESDTGVQRSLETAVARGGGAKISIDGERVRGFSRLIGEVPGVIFTPEDVLLTTGPPSERRIFLDYTAAQVSEGFLEDLKEYRKVLRQRNAVLKEMQSGGVGGHVLNALDRVLAERSESVFAGRIRVLEDLRSELESVFGAVFGEGERLATEYVSSVGGSGGADGYGDIYHEELAAHRDDDIRRGYTTRGPHCDDVSILLGGLSLRSYGSQGRKRLAAIALKMAQAAVITRRSGERPVVLLDDIFSELDEEVAGRVRGFLFDSYQNFITSPVDIDFPKGGGMKRFYIENGDIEERLVQRTD
jgi:DNA replication and repair protein RecF